MAEPRSSRWRRRSMTIPTMLFVTALAVLGLPLLLTATVVADLVRLRFRLPTARVYLFLLQYLINDTVEILISPIYWVLAGFGTGLHRQASIARHERIQNWSLEVLVRRASRLLGLRVQTNESSVACLSPGPVIVVSRHVSLFDASLPGLLFNEQGLGVRGVIMAELLADPGFDLIYGRAGSVFIPRDNGPEAVAEIRTMTETADEQTAYVIFPEGRLFRPSVRDRSLSRLVASDPVRGTRLSSLQHLLPPRPGGLLALLDALPGADVIVVRHQGLDRYARVADLWRSVPVKHPVSVNAERIPRSEIPDDEAGRTRWLDDLWLTLDRELDPTLMSPKR